MKFYMMIGLPASGKTTYIKNNFQHCVVHSSDAIRKELYGDVNSQDFNTKVFNTLHKRVIDDLKNGKDVVYDATNISMKRRYEFLCRLKKEVPDVCTIAVLMATPVDTCLHRLIDRNRHSEQQVPTSVLQKMYTTFDTPWYNEGWDICTVVYDESFTLYNIDTLFNSPVGLNWIKQFNPHHTMTLGQHMYNCAELLPIDSSTELQYATLLHDIGKVKTMKFEDAYGNKTDIAHYYNHENTGAYDSLFVDYEDKDTDVLYVSLLIRWHMLPFTLTDAKESTKENYKKLLTEPVWDDIMTLHQADLQSR